MYILLLISWWKTPTSETVSDDYAKASRKIGNDTVARGKTGISVSVELQMSLRCFPVAEQAATNDNGFERSSKALSSCQRSLVCNFWSMDADFLVPSRRASMLVNHAGNAHCPAVSS